jgi:hypothetical protein
MSNELELKTEIEMLRENYRKLVNDEFDIPRFSPQYRKAMAAIKLRMKLLNINEETLLKPISLSREEKALQFTF